MPSPTPKPTPTVSPTPTATPTPTPSPTTIPTTCTGSAPNPGDVCWDGYWWIERTQGESNPGPNTWTSANVSVQSDGMHLKVNGSSSDVQTEALFGYGTYSWKITAPALDTNNVLGLFTYNNDDAYDHREIDFEIAKFGKASLAGNAQFTVQPASITSNLDRITVPTGSLNVSFTWSATKVVFTAGSQTWTYTGSSIPKPSAPVHMNLWAFSGNHPNQEVVINSFQFTP